MWITRQPRPKYPLQKSNPRKNKLLKTLEDYIIGHDKDVTSILLHLWRDQMIVTGYKQIKEWVNRRDVTDEDMKDFKGDYQRLAERQMRPIWERTMQDAVSPDNPQFDWAKKFTREEQKPPENPLGGRNSDVFHPTGGTEESGPSPTTGGSGSLKPFFPTFDFHPQKDGVRLWAQQHTAELVKDATEEQRKAIKAVISQCTEKQFSVEETARNIRSTIGLNSRQAAANTKYYNRVKEQLAKDHPKMKPENIEKRARKKADAYAKDQLNYRARMIARTEIGNAYNAGAIYGVKRAIDQGLISSATKIWVTSKNEANMCPGCSKLDGVEIPLDEQFDFNGEKIDAPLAHPNGKCTLEFHVEEPEFDVMEMDDDPIFTDGYGIGEENDTIDSDFSSDTDAERNRRVHFGESKDFEQFGRTVHAEAIKNTGNNLYIDRDLSLSRLEVRKLDALTSGAKERLGITDTCNIPFIVTDNRGRLGSYNPVSNIMFLDYRLTNSSETVKLQQLFAMPEEDDSTVIHELFHWEDAEEYRREFGEIIDASSKSDYSQIQRERARKMLIDAGIDLGDPYWIEKNISEYAARCLILDNNLEEVYTEFRTKEVLSKG